MERSSRVLSGSLALTSISPPLVHEEGAVRHAVDAHPLEVAHRAHNCLRMARVHTGDRHVAHDLPRLHANEIDRTQHRVRVCDGIGDARERAAPQGPDAGAW